MREYSQQVETVRKQFETQIGHYTSEEVPARQSNAIPFLTQWLREHDVFADRTMPFRICEFGGASGILLRELDSVFQGRAELYDCDIVDRYQQYKALEKIHFINRSVLDCGFEDNYFDIVIMRNVIHHLIHTEPKRTPSNQTFGVSELFRVLKPGGLLLLEEHVNQSERACRVLYFLSRCISRLNISIKSFEITPYTIVAFLTQNQVAQLIESNRPPGSRVLEVQYERRKIALHWKLTFLRNNCGLLFVVVAK